MAARFPVPDAYRELERSPQRDVWCDRLPNMAEALAARWHLAPDGAPMYGFLSVIWPVRNDAGRRLVLKVHDFSAGTEGERPALAAAGGIGMVELVQSDPTMNALLLQRLDSERTLELVEVDEACDIVGDIVSGISSRAAPKELRSIAEVTDSIHASITAALHRTPAVLPRAVAHRALETLETIGAQARLEPHPLRLVHGDLHFANVLHTVSGEPEGWVAIDPLPCAGYPEWEVAPTIRNRWDDAVATGDPDRALRRRFDRLCDRAGLDRAFARDILRAIAVDNVLWLADDKTAHPIRQQHLLAYSVVATW